VNDHDRLQHFLQQAEQLSGLSERQFGKLTRTLADVVATPSEMQQPQIAFFDAKPYELAAFARKNNDICQLQPIEASLTPETAGAARDCVGVCIFVNDRCDSEIVARLADLGVRIIALRCAGYNNVDLKACKQHQIDVVRVPKYSPHAVAEHTVALMLMLNRHLHRAYQRNRSGVFTLDGLVGFDMHGKTAGVIGTGAIGQCVVDILLGFGCRVLAFDKHPDDALAKREGLQYVALEQLLAESDIVTLHVPLFDETHHMINADSIAHMKRGAMLINTSRGGLVDTRALIDGLKAGQIGFAGLDVYEEEAGIFFHDISDRVLDDDVLARLMTFNNVVITSHQAFLTREALDNIAETTLQSIAEFHSGKRGDELSFRVS
jgi:D-lactate dehydrogenase